MGNKKLTDKEVLELVVGTFEDTLKRYNDYKFDYVKKHGFTLEQVKDMKADFKAHTDEYEDFDDYMSKHGGYKRYQDWMMDDSHCQSAINDIINTVPEDQMCNMVTMLHDKGVVSDEVYNKYKK